MPVNVKAVLSSNIKTRWREPFASEAMNKKGVGTISPGVYRGLLIEETSPPVDLTVTIASDLDSGDHVAIAETTNGFSVNYNNSDGDFDLDLSSAALLSQTVVIVLELSYSVGADTSGRYLAYTVADYDALSVAEKNGVVALGTVEVPGSGAIPQANISPNRRSTPNDRPIGQPQIRLTRNSGFEVADDGTSLELSFRHWRSIVTAGAGDANLVSHVADSNSGTKSVELDVLGAGSFSFQLTQDINVPVLAGQTVRVRAFKKALVAANSGTATLGVSYRDVDGNATGAQTVAFDVDGVDASFSEVGEIFTVPAGAYELAFIEVNGTTLNYPGAGSSLLIDDVDLFIERTTANQDLDNELRGTGSIVGALTFEEPGESYASVGAALRFKNIDANSGALELDRKDGGSAPLAPMDFVVKGRLDRLGEDLIGSEANADKSRIVAPVSVFAGVEYTLMWESVPAGVKGYRKYVKSDGTLAETVNAKWNNTTNLWAKDVNGQDASKTEYSPAGQVMSVQLLHDSWTDTTGTLGWGSGFSNQDPISLAVTNPIGSAMALDIKDGNFGALVNVGALGMDFSSEFPGSNKVINGFEQVEWTPTVTTIATPAVVTGSDCWITWLGNKLVFVVVNVLYEPQITSAVATIKIGGDPGLFFSGDAVVNSMCAVSGNTAASNDTPVAGAYWRYSPSTNEFILHDGSISSAVWDIDAAQEYGASFSMMWMMEA